MIRSISEYNSYIASEQNHKIFLISLMQLDQFSADLEDKKVS